jgi:outer membrane protein OmpA-like peptidoglycan-associated protein
MNDNEGASTRTGLWAVLIVVAVLLISALTWQVTRSQHPSEPAGAADAGAAPSPTASGSPTVQVDALADELLDVPLTGDLVGVLYFGVGEAALPANAAAEIDKVRQALIAAPKLKVMLSGFHDASGDPTQNAVLARERAKAARDALVAAGVDAGRIALRKPEQTLADGSPQEARRVEMRLVE